jgi:hypothetical protein
VRRFALLGLVTACWTSTVEPPVPRPDPPRPRVQETVIRDAPSPFMVLSDDRALYWVGGEDGAEGIWRAEKRVGARPERLARTADARGLTLDGDRLWWGDGNVVRWVRTAGGPVADALRAPTDVHDLTRDGDDTVVASYDPMSQTMVIARYRDDGTLRHSRELVGQTPIVVAAPEGVYIGADTGLVRLGRDGKLDRLTKEHLPIEAMFVDREHVFVGSYGEVHRVARSGAAGSIRVSAGNGEVQDVTADDRFVYWGSALIGEEPGSAIYRAPKLGGRARVVARVDGEPGSVFVDGDHLYWADRTAGMIVRRLREPTR